MTFSIVEDPLIKLVFDQDGHERRVQEYDGLPRAELAKMRFNAFSKEEVGKIRCAICHTPVWPTLYINRQKFYFKHVSLENTDCKEVDRLSTDQIDARRYNGQKEGSDHKKLKSLLEASIRADSNFSPEIHVEKNWYSADESKWRRPDIAATYLEDGKIQKIAFEVQLSSTFLKVMRARRDFYLEDNALLFWIFKEAKIDDQRQFQDDLFYNNNYNLFVIDQETFELSQERKKFILKCYYSKPVLNNFKIEEVWQQPCFVSFDELKKDFKNQRAFWFDYEGESSRLNQEAALASLEKKKEEIRKQYMDFANQLSKTDGYYLKEPYLNLHRAFEDIGIILPEKIPSKLAAFNRLVFSAKAGEPMMTDFENLLQVANCGYEYGKEFMWYFGQVLKKYKDNWETLLQQDHRAASRKKLKRHMSWKEKAQIIREGYKGAFEPDRDYEKLFYFLFPEIPTSSQN